MARRIMPRHLIRILNGITAQQWAEAKSLWEELNAENAVEQEMWHSLGALLVILEEGTGSASWMLRVHLALFHAVKQLCPTLRSDLDSIDVILQQEWYMALRSREVPIGTRVRNLRRLVEEKFH